MFDLTGKNVLVTGASGGIGGEIARRLHASGASVGVSGTRLEPLKALAADLGERAHVLACNLSDTAAITELPKQASEAMGSVDILVNNAGITRDGLMVRMKESDWDLVLDINLKGSFLCSQQAAKQMMKQKSGAIVNIASIVGVMGNFGQANYSASKAGVIGLTKTLAREVASRGIRVNAVAPGFIDTEMTRVLAEPVKQELIKGIPMAKLGMPEDVARCVAFLVSDRSSYITGQVINVNGGMLM